MRTWNIKADQCVIVTIPPIDDSAIISITNELADCGMNAKIEQDGKALAAAMDIIQKKNTSMKTQADDFAKAVVGIPETNTQMEQ